MSLFGTIYADTELSHRALSVYMYLRDRSDAERKCWPSINTIAADLRLSRSTVKRAIADLEKAGYLQKDHRFRENGSHTSNLYTVDWLEALPFTTLHVDGNHENYDLLYKLPVEHWSGGKVHRLRPHVLHLMRGQVFNFDGRTFFTMGGASSHDVQDGILDRHDPEFDLKYYYLRREHARFRINHESWWKEELPSDDEYAEAKENLVKANHQVDFIITHCAPSSIEDIIGKSTYVHDRLTDFLEEVYHTVTFRHWYCGHYHENKEINSKFTVLYKNVVQVI